uniref:Putative tick metalloprotease 55 n=1 Tax=Amblyomma cajennense TaxID=34607 RepID=A0A023FBT4_AMBCJ
MALKIVVILSLLSLQSLHAAIVPEHAAVVYPQLFDVRDDLGTRVLRVNDKLTLNLKKSAVLPDDFVLIEDWEGVPRHTYVSAVRFCIYKPRVKEFNLSKQRSNVLIVSTRG